MAYTKQDCIRGLEEAQQMLGHDPAYHEYRELDISPSQNTIENICDSWNETLWNDGRFLQRKESMVKQVI